METKCKTAKILGERPTKTPAGVPISAEANIYNAPRPLFGVNWEGEFRFGIFYSAIEPGSDYAEQFDQRNAQLDARVLEFVSADAIWAWGQAHYTAQGIDLDAEGGRADRNIWETVLGAFYRAQVVQ